VPRNASKVVPYAKARERESWRDRDGKRHVHLAIEAWASRKRVNKKANGDALFFSGDASVRDVGTECSHQVMIANIAVARPGTLGRARNHFNSLAGGSGVAPPATRHGECAPRHPTGRQQRGDGSRLRDPESARVGLDDHPVFCELVDHLFDQTQSIRARESPDGFVRAAWIGS
jgi:hypothetical protein